MPGTLQLVKDFICTIQRQIRFVSGTVSLQLAGYSDRRPVRYQVALLLGANVNILILDGDSEITGAP